MSAERFAGYRCTFMHMMTEALTEWITFGAHGTTRAGRDAPDKSGEPCDLGAEIG